MISAFQGKPLISGVPPAAVNHPMGSEAAAGTRSGNTSGYRILDNAALDVVKNWMFEPV